MNAECKDIFTAVENFGELILEVVNIQLEAVTLSHFDGEEVVVILLGLPAGGILGEEHLRYLLKIVKRIRRQRIKPIRGHIFQTERKGQTHEKIVTGVNHYLVSKKLYVLDWIAGSRVVVDVRVVIFSENSHSKIISKKGNQRS